MRSNSNSIGESPHKKKISILNFGEDQPAVIEKKISDNGSLVFSQFKLNSQGLTILQKNITYMESKYFKDLRLEDFEILSRLGSGNYGSVDKVHHKPTNDIYALKQIRYVSNDVQESLLKKELQALILCNSDYVVQCAGAFYSRGQIYILMEYMDMGSLQVILEKNHKIPESITMLIIQQILLGLEYLHSNRKIIHRDIKPHNILVNKKGEVKIADFGICSIGAQSDQKFNTFIGTLSYMSPERMNGEEYGTDCDIWSVGMMALQFITGKLPLEYNNKTMSMIAFIQIVKKFTIQEYIQTLSLTESTAEFLIMCLQQQPQDRANASQLLNTKAIRMTSNLKINQFKQWLQLAIEEL